MPDAFSPPMMDCSLELGTEINTFSLKVLVLKYFFFYHSHKEDTKIVPILQSYENGFPNGQA